MLKTEKNRIMSKLSEKLKKPVQAISDHEGILKISPRDGGTRVEIAFDPQQLREADVRAIITRHFSSALEGSGSSRRWVMRLDGEACEAAASKLERRIERLPGVRRALATYVGHVLCLTFDPAVTDEDLLFERVRNEGASVSPLGKAVPVRKSFPERLRAGELNEEISCGLGFLFMITGAVTERVAGSGLGSGVLFALSYVFGGQYGVRSAIASLRAKTLDVDLLMVLAALGAAIVGAPFEGALLLFLFSFSNVLQSNALDRTRRAIESLLKLRPETALRKTAEGTELVPVSELLAGDTVIVRPGDLLPVDGVVTEGETYVDESSLTGESLPVHKKLGGEVFAGTLNQSGAMEVRVVRGSEETTLAKMVRLVAEAQAEKSQTQRFLEKAEQNYAAGVIIFTAAVLLVPWLSFGEEFGKAFYRAMTVMVVASPCALIISTPATVLSAIGGAARRGILIKGGSHLETAARADIVCLDKTGTLTIGRPSVTHIATSSGVEMLSDGQLSQRSADLLRLCAGLEARSEHPLAAAIVVAARQLGLELPEAQAFQSVAGKGAQATIGGDIFLVGSHRFFDENGVSGMDLLSGHEDALQADGKTCVWFGRRNAGGVEALAVFGLADTLRPDAVRAVEDLRRCGIRRIVMLTGDQVGVARAIARQAGLEEFRAGLLPADKVAAVRELKREGVVAMIGDGVNDAPALAAAHLGIAMGGAGTDIAMETADVVLMGDRLENIPALLSLARQAKRVLIQNLVFAGGVIVVLAGAALGFALPLPVGVVGHEGSTVLVCLNGLRLLGWRGRSTKEGVDAPTN